MRLNLDHSFLFGASEDWQGIAMGSMDPVNLVRGLEQSSVKSNLTADDAYTVATQDNETLLMLVRRRVKGRTSIPLR